MNRNTMGYAQAVYRDKSIDPGSAPHHETQHGALLNLDAAIGAGELPTLPAQLTQILAARGKLKAFADTMFGHQLTLGVPHTTQVGNDLVSVAFTDKELPDPQTFTERMQHAWVADQAMQVQSQVVQHLVRDAQMRTSGAITMHLNEYLSVIREAVMGVVEQARQAATILTDVDITNPSVVAKASTKQRDAVSSLPDLARRYNRLRMLQRDVLVASDEQAPGVNDHSPERGASAWHAVFDSGLMEFERVNFVDHGPAHDQPASTRILAVARRSDVWVPTVDEAEEAWQLMAAPGVV